MSLLTLANIVYQQEDKRILNQVSLQVARGEIVTLIGPNGAGKSTLVRIALGLLKPTQGTVQQAAGLRVAYMPQHFVVNPYLPMTVQAFLALMQPSPQAQDIAQALQKVGLPNIAMQRMDKLSGGELQRVLLARAVLRKPDLLVLDEPAQGVDLIGQQELYALIQTLRDELNCGVLMVSHDLHLVMASTQRVICLNQHICCEGHPESVGAHPEYRRLFGAQGMANLAIYNHHHDHHHNSHGDICQHESH